MDFDTDRRGLLKLAGTGTAASLAGCGALQDQSQNDDPTGTGTAGADGSGQQRVAVSTPANQQALQQRQQEIQSALSSGNISQAEAQKRYRTAQSELRSAAVDSFRDRAESLSGLTIVDTIEQFGVLLVAGTPAALIRTLSFDSVNALLPEATFQQARTQAQAQQQGNATEASGTTGTPEAPTN